MTKTRGRVLSTKNPKFIYKLGEENETTDNSSSPTNKFKKTHIKAAQDEFYFDFKTALEEISTTNTTILDAVYLTFLGFQFQPIYSRSALTLNFTYELVQNSRRPRDDSIICIVLDKLDTAEHQTGSVFNKYILVWGMIHSVNTADATSLRVEVLSDITEPDTSEVLLKLMTYRRNMLAITTNRYYVQYMLMREMMFLETDLNPKLLPILQGNCKVENPQAHYLGGMDIDMGVDKLNDGQTEAAQFCLDHTIGMVQGPPGTGKSHLALHMTRMLSDVDGMPPILLMTMKNQVLDNVLKKLLQLKMFDKDQVLRLGQQYDKTSQEIEAISTNSPKFEELLRSTSSNPKRKKAILNLEFMYGRFSNRFDNVDNCRIIDLENIWKSFTDTQQIKFIEYAKEHFPDQEYQENQTERSYNKVHKALRRWCPDTLHTYKNLEPKQEPVTVAPDPRKQNKEEDEEATLEISPNDKVFSIRDYDEDTISFCVDEFPCNWRKMSTRSIEQPWDLTPEERLKFIYSLIYNNLHEALKGYITEQGHADHNAVSVAKQRFSWKRKGKLYKNYSVVATTVHGALIHKKALSEANVVTVVCEEASQVSERDLLGALPTTTLHLMMIGDHQQLPPFSSHPSLADNNASLMTRMVKDGFPYKMLTEQFRMSQEICSLLADTYPSLRTINRSTADRTLPDLKLKHHVYWWNHEFVEYQEYGVSRSNELEADKICGLARYLVTMSVKTSRITIIAGYQGQVQVIRDLLQKCVEIRRYPGELLEIPIKTIDSYQGSENDIVLLSLVRNNAAKAMGFMENPGRKCVALSRARLALFIVGSRSTYSNEKTEWAGLVEKLNSTNQIGEELILINDNKEEVRVTTVAQLDKICNEWNRTGSF